MDGRKHLGKMCPKAKLNYCLAVFIGIDTLSHWELGLMVQYKSSWVSITGSSQDYIVWIGLHTDLIWKRVFKSRSDPYSLIHVRFISWWSNTTVKCCPWVSKQTEIWISLLILTLLWVGFEHATKVPCLQNTFDQNLHEHFFT